VPDKAFEQLQQHEESTMSYYETSVRRAAFALAAAAMTAITIGVSVVMPSKMDSGHDGRWAASTVTPAGSTDGVSASARVDVVAVRESGSSMAPCTSSNPNPRPEG
jgi:hypothetical protein